MRGTIPPLPEYAFMTLCSEKAQGHLHLHLHPLYEHGQHRPGTGSFMYSDTTSLNRRPGLFVPNGLVNLEHTV